MTLMDDLRANSERLQLHMASLPKGKHCPRCRRWLLAESFRPDASSRSGLASWCRACMAGATREWRERNREAYNAARRVPPVELECVECGEALEGGKGRLVCSRRCKDRRYARFHPEQVKEKNRQHQANRRARARNQPPTAKSLALPPEQPSDDGAQELARGTVAVAVELDATT